MKKQIFLLLFAFQTLTSFAQEKVPFKAQNYVVTNVSVVSMQNNEILKNQDVFIENGKITNIAPSKKIKNKELLVIEGKGKFIMPGLADAHVHFPENETEMERTMQ
jgi:imidazolonepropionase-like amidohydrolase